jgi:hypothetical protein
VFFADTFAIRAPGVVAVREYGSSPRHTARSVSTKTIQAPFHTFSPYFQRDPRWQEPA